MELWDLELSSGILWDHMEGDALGPALVEAIERLRQGTARTRSNLPIPALARELGAVWLAGGRATALDLTGPLAALGVPVWRAEHPLAVAERGARALLPHASPLAVVDLGQSRLKVFLGDPWDGSLGSAPRDGRFEHGRPWDRLPLEPTPAVDPARARASLRAWVSAALRDATARTGLRPRAVVFALPCELADAPTPGSSSYLGLQGDTAFVADTIAAARWTPQQVQVLNDAELAAAAASLDPRTHGTLTLVLTLGFGVGGALRLP